MKIILSSGTPCSMSTSTAFMAEPPVAGMTLELVTETDHGAQKIYQALDLAKEHISMRYLEGTVHHNWSQSA